MSAKTPIGYTKFSLSGWQTYSANSTELTLSKGVAVLPSPIAFLLDAFSPSIAGALSLADTSTTFFTAMQHGNIAKAAQAFFLAPFSFTNAMLFGHETITLPLTVQEGVTIELKIPFGGVFASLKTPSLTIPSYTYVYTDVDSSEQITVSVDAAKLSLTGTQISGLVPVFLKAIGL